MGLGDISGQSRRASSRNPQGQGICDRTGFALNHNRMQRQFQWGGAKLFDTGYLVRPKSLDKPQDQFRSLILPADPYPTINPRPDYYQTPPYPAVTPGNQGFSQYELTITQSQAFGPQGIGEFIIGISPIGVAYISPGQQNYPTDKGNTLASLQSVSGVPPPLPITDWGTTIAKANTTQTLLLPNPNRTYLTIYSPGGQQFGINTGTAVWGLTTNLMVGPGQAWFWATLQGFGPAYTGAITVISQQPGAPVWAWDDSPNYLVNNGGFLALSNVFTWPTTPANLGPGAVWSNGGFVSVIAPLAGTPTVAVYINAVTSQTLLLSGAGMLPLADPHSGGQLWNNGGFVCVSAG